MIPLKKPEMQGAKFSRNETYLSYVAMSGKLKQRCRLGFFSGIITKFLYLSLRVLIAISPSNMEIIQNLTMTFGSFHPLSSKW